MKKIPARPSKVAGFSILLLTFFIGGNFSRAQDVFTCPGGEVRPNETTYDCCDPNTCDNYAGFGQGSLFCHAKPPGATTFTDGGNSPGFYDEVCKTAQTELNCASPLQIDPSSNSTTCCMPSTSTDECLEYKEGDTFCMYGDGPTQYNFCSSTTSTSELPDDQTIRGMTIGPKCLLNGQCKFNIYDALGIRTSVRNEGDPTSVGIFVQDIVLSATMFIGTIVTIAIIVSGLMRIMAGASGKDPTKAKSGLINALIGLLIVVSSYLIIRLVQYIAKGF